MARSSSSARSTRSNRWRSPAVRAPASARRSSRQTATADGFLETARWRKVADLRAARRSRFRPPDSSCTRRDVGSDDTIILRDQQPGDGAVACVGHRGTLEVLTRPRPRAGRSRPLSGRRFAPAAAPSSSRSAVADGAGSRRLRWRCATCSPGRVQLAPGGGSHAGHHTPAATWPTRRGGDAARRSPDPTRLETARRRWKGVGRLATTSTGAGDSPWPPTERFVWWTCREASRWTTGRTLGFSRSRAKRSPSPRRAPIRHPRLLTRRGRARVALSSTDQENDSPDLGTAARDASRGLTVDPARTGFRDGGRPADHLLSSNRSGAFLPASSISGGRRPMAHRRAAAER